MSNPSAIAIALLLFLLAPIVLGCVNFEAHHISTDKVAAELDVSIWDEFQKVCHFHGLPDLNDGLYHLDCFANNGVGVFDSTSGNVQYVSVAGSFNFPTVCTSNPVEWTACEYGCCSPDDSGSQCNQTQWCFV